MDDDTGKPAAWEPGYRASGRCPKCGGFASKQDSRYYNLGPLCQEIVACRRCGLFCRYGAAWYRFRPRESIWETDGTHL